MAAVSRPGPLGIRVPLSRGIARASTLVVGVAGAAVALAACMSVALLAGEPAVRVVVAAAVVVLVGCGVVACTVLAIVGPWRAPLVAVLAIALAGIAGGVVHGVDVAGGPLLPTAHTIVTVVALAYHLLSSQDLRDEGRRG